MSLSDAKRARAEAAFKRKEDQAHDGAKAWRNTKPSPALSPKTWSAYEPFGWQNNPLNLTQPKTAGKLWHPGVRRNRIVSTAGTSVSSPWSAGAPRPWSARFQSTATGPDPFVARSGDQPIAHRLFARQFAGAPRRFRFFSRRSLGGLLVVPAPLHFSNAFALHFLF
jgi:hypothetical protein